jgi:hypothetical protein
MGNGPFIDGLPIKNGRFSMAMLNNQMVDVYSQLPRKIHGSFKMWNMTEHDEIERGKLYFAKPNDP